MKASTVQRLGFSIAVLAVALAGCPARSNDPGSTIQSDDPGSAILLSSNAETPAELSIADRSGFLVNARDATRPESGSDFEIEAVPDTADALKVSWISSPCQETPHLTVDGSSLSNLQLILDAGPAEDVECPSIGVAFSVILVFGGEVSVHDVEGRRVGE